MQIARSTMTLKSCRKTLEEDMGLQAGELKPFKDLLGSLIDRVSLWERRCAPHTRTSGADQPSRLTCRS